MRSPIIIDSVIRKCSDAVIEVARKDRLKTSKGIQT